MQTYYADLHVHIGRGAHNSPVKMAASPQLTLDNIIAECVERKGIQIVGIIDAMCPPVLTQLQEQLASGALTQSAGGGLNACAGGLTIILGAELEVSTGGKAAHYLAYFPTVEALISFQHRVAPHITNMSLSSQVVRVTPGQLLADAVACGGIFGLAHAFAPHKGYFGNCGRSLTDHFTPHEIAHIRFIEVGLSADTHMADRVSELHMFPYVTNSDAHSLGTIGREYMALQLREPTFAELVLALQREDGRAIAANYGLDPRLGKYYRTFCPRCSEQLTLPPDRRCPECNSLVVRGVHDRLLEIADTDATVPGRPPYIHQVPLQFIRGLGPAGLGRLLERFGTHMNILHKATATDLAEVVGAAIAANIVAARGGELDIVHGAGGRYGRVNS